MNRPRLFARRSETLSPSLGEERRALLQTLEETKRELDLAYLGFNQSTDADLVEFYLFEVDALRARHSYLLRRIKELDPTATTGGNVTAAAPPPRARRML